MGEGDRDERGERECQEGKEAQNRKEGMKNERKGLYHRVTNRQGDGEEDDEEEGGQAGAMLG